MSKENPEMSNELNKDERELDAIEFVLSKALPPEDLEKVRAEIMERMEGSESLENTSSLEVGAEAPLETQLEEIPEEVKPPSLIGNIIAGAVVAGGINYITQLVLAEDEGLNLISTATATSGGAIVGGAMAKMGRSYGTTSTLATAIGGATGYFWRNNPEVEELLEEPNL